MTDRAIRKRDGVTVQHFDVEKIRRAVTAAWESQTQTLPKGTLRPPPEEAIEKIVTTTLAALPDGELTVEDVQDTVEIALMRCGFHKVAKHYIIYREERAEARALRDKKPDPKAISDYIHASKYARYRDELGRREVYTETVDRVAGMHIDRFPHLQEEIQEAFALVHEQKVLPSMRSMQFAGPAILQNHCRIFNCSFSHVDRFRVFSEAMYLLLCGCGVGYSVQFDHVEKLPPIGYIDAKKIQHHVVGDTIEGWADALDALFQGFQDGVYVEFAYHLVRPAGSALKTSGGRAPGHRQLKASLEATRQILQGAQGRQLRPVECHRIMCHVADAPLSGGIRRCLPRGTLIHTSRGLIPIENVKIGDKVRTSGQGHAAWSIVSDVLDQGRQRLMHVKTHMGIFRCTPKHQMAVMTAPNVYTFKQASELKPDDRLVFVEHVIPGHKTTLPPWGYTRNEHDTRSVDISTPKLDTDMAWFIGFVHGNGYVHVNRTDKEAGGSNFVTLSTDDREQKRPAIVQRCHAAFERFGVNSQDYKIEYENTRVIRASGIQLALYFEKFKLPKTALEVPPCILEGTPTIRAAYLAGLLDSDGGVKNRPVLLCASVYPNFLRQLQVLYASLGIPARISKNREANGEWKPLWHLSLVGELPRDKFKEHIEPHAVKKIPEDYTSQRDYGYPREWIIDSDLDYNQKWAPNSRQMTVGTFERCGGKREAYLPITVQSSEYVDEVEQTYDLTVEGAHEFVAEGLLVHNSAMLSLFSLGDSEMMNVKTGDWYSREPWLANANNSVALKRDEIKKSQFKRIFKMTRQWGEPGFYFTDNYDYGCNPCAEINFFPRLIIDGHLQSKLAKRDIQVQIGEEYSGWGFCNLCTLNAAKFTSLDDFMAAARAATFIGTLQASYTRMPYLGWVSETIAERDALLGVSMTGMLDAPEVACNPSFQRAAANKVKLWNREFATMLNIEPAARTTCIKPEGTASLALGGVGSGHHAHHARRYIRRVIADELEHLFQAFRIINPHMCVRKPDGKWVIEFPVEAPLGATVKADLNALQFLDMVRSTQQNWVLPGTGDGRYSPGLTHNVSNTVQVKEDEWDIVAEYLWENRNSFTGVSLLPNTGDKDYAFAPNEEIQTQADEARWNNLIAHYTPLDYSALQEETDDTDLKSEPACAGGACAIV